MTEAIADADIISTFGKVGRLDLLQRLFDRLYVAPAVYRELLRAEQVGFSWVSAVKQIVEVIPLTESQSHEAANLFGAYPQLGSGEVETFILARNHHLPCLTNDRQAQEVGKTLGIVCLDLEEILWALRVRNVLEPEALGRFIEEIEEKDRTRIKAKEQLLRS
jgi:predicted nucleic acid-binding protein